jgi:thiosulfate/3-mercaptopyruvate sulfurtransferase
VVETEWLASQLSVPQLRIVDLRAAGDYRQGHIPQAVHLEPGALVDTQHVEQGRRFAPEALAGLMGRLGIDNTTEVVAYDDQGGLDAARLWWLLTATGHTTVHVLNGGWGKWQREKRPVTTEVLQPAPATFTVRQVDGLFATKEDVREVVGSPAVTVVDARSGPEYRGSLRYAARGGHIPGAVHLEWKRALQQDGTFLPPEALSTLVRQAGVSPGRRIITYCQSGVRAAHVAFVLTMLGYPNVAVYDGSWAEWGNDPQSPIE